MAELVLEGQGLCLHRQTGAIVDHVDIRIDSGGVSGLVGANGGGKNFPRVVAGWVDYAR